MNITRQQLSSFIHDRYIKRGEQIVEEGTIVLEKIHSEQIEAFAIGTGIYHVKLFKSNSSAQIKGTCNCPAFFDFGPCKHIAAAGLARMQVGYEPDDWCCEQIQIFKNALQSLHKQPKENLISIIMDCIAQDQELLHLIPQPQNTTDSNE
jgi:hypothetical protein